MCTILKVFCHTRKGDDPCRTFLIICCCCCCCFGTNKQKGYLLNWDICNFLFFSSNCKFHAQRDMVPLISVPFHRQVPPASSLIRQYLDEVPKTHRKPSREAAKVSTNLQLKLNTRLNHLLDVALSTVPTYFGPHGGAGGGGRKKEIGPWSGKFLKTVNKLQRQLSQYFWNF